jgi:hypothetical protein
MHEMGEPAGLGWAFFVIILTPIITIFSTITFIYMARFKGKMMLVSALSLLIFGIKLNILLIAILSSFMPILFYFTNELFYLINGLDVFNKLRWVIGFILIIFLLLPIIVLYGMVGYACRKWRIKNNIPSNSIFEKDIITIIVTLLIYNMWIFIRIII